MVEPKSKKYKDLLIYHLSRMDQYVQEKTDGQLSIPAGGMMVAETAETVGVEQYHEALDWALDYMERFNIIGGNDASVV